MRDSRNTLSTLLVLAGALLLLAGTAAGYGRVHLTEREVFADRALEALESDGVRRAVERELTDELADRARAFGLGNLRPEIRALIDTVITSAPFHSVFRAATIEFHRVFFEQGRDAARFDLGAVAPVLQREARAISPELDRLLSREIDAELLTVRRGRLAGDTLAAAERLRTLGIVLPLLAAAAFAGAIALARPHSRGLLRVGLAMIVTAAVTAAAVPLVRTLAIERLDGKGDLTAAQVQDAARGVYDAYLSDLLVWALVLGLAGLVLCAAALAVRRLHWRSERP